MRVPRSKSGYVQFVPRLRRTFKQNAAWFRTRGPATHLAGNDQQDARQNQRACHNGDQRDDCNA
jgi:hypothetical protein